MKLPVPYQGKGKYIFVSYSHKDMNKVDDIICKLDESGYNVWFDSGIVPGSEWDENIARHIEECGCFVAFMSKNYLDSNNCKDELNYSRDLEKDRLVVYLEEVTLPSGLAMRINRLQSVFRYAYRSEKEFYEKLFSADCLDQCKKTEDEEQIQEEVVEIESEKGTETIEGNDSTEKKKRNPFARKNREKKPVKKLSFKGKVLLVNIICTVLTILFLPFRIAILPAAAQLVLDAVYFSKHKATENRKLLLIWLIVSAVLAFIGLITLFFI